MAKFRSVLHTLGWQTFIFAFVLVFFVILAIWTSPTSAVTQVTATITTQATALATPLPQEWISNARQTDGIALGGTILVLIVVIGTLSVILGKNSGYTPRKK